MGFLKFKSIGSIKIILLFCFWTAVFIIWNPDYVRAQDPVYSQYYKKPETLNPAFSGLSENAKITGVFRSQWSGFSNAYRTYSLGYNQYFRSINSGLGVLAMVDNQGDGIITQTKVSAFYSYRIRINRHSFLQSGIEISGIQSKLDHSKLIFGSQIDPVTGPISPGGITPGEPGFSATGSSRSYMDLGFGLLFSSPAFYAGIGLKHLNNPKVGFLDNPGPSGSAYPVLYTLTLGSEFSTDPNNLNRLKPNILIASQKDLFQVNAGVHQQFTQWSAGVYYRHNSSFSDAIQLHFGFIYEDFSFGYSYDLTISRLADHSRGAHEFTLVLNLDNKQGRINVNYSDCLNLFRY